MKGLIYKDFFSLRKNMKIFALVSVGALIVGIMFLLSSKYGNLARELALMEQESQVDGLLTMQAMETGMWFVVLLPIGFITDVHQCFKEDARVGFGKVLSGVALSHGQIVGSRYLTTLIYGGVSMAVALVCAFFVQLVPMDMEMGNLFVGTMTFTAIAFLYMSFYLFMVYLCGTKKAELIQMIPLVIMFVAMGFAAVKLNGLTDEEITRLILESGDKLKWFLENGYKVLIPASVAGMLLSYAGSVAAVKRQRRVL